MTAHPGGGRNQHAAASGSHLRHRRRHGATADDTADGEHAVAWAVGHWHTSG